MAEEGDSGEKTEAPSGKKIGTSRSQGMTGASMEFSQVFGMIAAFMAIKHVLPGLWQDMSTLFVLCFSADVTREGISTPYLHKSFISVVLLLGPTVLWIVAVAGLVGGFIHACQTKFNWSWQLLKPKFSLLNPVGGIKKIFGVMNIMQLLKQVAKLAVIGPVAYFAFFDYFPLFMKTSQLSIPAILSAIGQAASGIFTSIMKILVVISILDLCWKKYKYWKELKMSKQEAKDEKKSSEGDETIRRKIIQIGMMRVRERMMQAVPTADVVVTNPTHFAVALKYDATPGVAPMVVAKGQGHVALRIRELAKRSGVPVIERKPLARALFKAVDVGQEIPYELFRAVAEILAYVYRLKGRNPLNRQQRK